MARTITVNTLSYEASHGHKPRQPRFSAVSTWAFEIDQQEPPIFITASYATAVKQAKAQAQHSITVLP